MVLYYDTFEQALALRNISTLLKRPISSDKRLACRMCLKPNASTEYTPVRYGESADGETTFFVARNDAK